VIRRGGSGIEQEADEFAAALLMPFHDFRRQLVAKTAPISKRSVELQSATVLRRLR
jgi:Zn-dependent peptidase ImmA (M78 family)